MENLWILPILTGITFKPKLNCYFVNNYKKYETYSKYGDD